MAYPEPEPGRIMIDADGWAKLQRLCKYGSASSIERVKTQMLAAARPLDKFSRFMPLPKPLNRREKLKRRLLDYRNRIALAWAALRGERMVREDDLP